MRRTFSVLAPAALAAGALLVPATADAATVTQVIGSAGCLGGPGRATVVSAPAADGSSTVAFTMSGVPDGAWTGGVGVGTSSDPSGGVTATPQTVTGGTFSTSTTSTAPWNGNFAIGAYATSPGAGELCEAVAGQQGTVSMAGTLGVVLAVHDARKFAADVTLSQVAKGHRFKVALVIKAGGTQRRTEVVTAKRSNQDVIFKGLKQPKPFTNASVVVTDLKTHHKESVSLTRVLG